MEPIPPRFSALKAVKEQIIEFIPLIAGAVVKQIY